MKSVVVFFVVRATERSRNTPKPHMRSASSWRNAV